MTRQRRIQYEGAWYHVMNRGAGRKYILKTAHNKETFLELMSEIHKKYSIEFHSYCIMDNHYHLLIHTPYANISEGMKYLQAMYTRIYNKEIESDGPIFRSRFKSILIESANSVLQVSRYIHFNPIDANLKNGLLYPWSSYNEFIIQNQSTPDWLKKNFILSHFNSGDNIKKFIDFHNSKIGEELKYFYFKNGKNDFCILNQEKLDECLVEWQIINNRLSLVSLEKIVKDYFSISSDDIKKALVGTSSIGRIAFLLIAVKVFNYYIKEIKDYLNLNYFSTVSKIIKNYSGILSEKR